MSIGRPNVVGELDYGHAGVAGAGDGDADRGPAGARPLRTDQATHLQDHDEEHPRTGHLSTVYYLLSSVCWYVYIYI